MAALGYFNPTDTPEQLAARKRELDYLASRMGGAQNVGQGVGDMLSGLAVGLGRSRANKAETAGKASGKVNWADILAKPQAPQVSGGEVFPNPALMTPDTPKPSPAQDFGGMNGIPASKSIPVAALTQKPVVQPPPDGGNWLSYANESAVRNKPINPKLQNSFSFLPEMGVSMKVFSGGQDNKGEGNRRTGSTRHDGGGAGDVFFEKNGKRLDWRNPADIPTLQAIVTRAKANGVTGFGAGEGYMQPGSVHVGFGNPGVWGNGGSGANAPAWLTQAYNAKYTPEAAQQPVQIASNDPQFMPASAHPQDVSQETMQPQAPVQQQPQQVAQAGPDVQKLYGILSNPWTSDQDKQMAQQMLQQQLQQQDPAYQIGLEKGRLELEQMRNPQVDPMKQVQLEQERIKLQQMRNPAPEKPTDDIQEYNFAVKQGYKGSFQEFVVGMKKAGAINVNNNIGSEVGTIPQGYELFTDPKTGGRSMRPIAGSEAAGNAAAAVDAKKSRDETQQLTNDIISEDIDRAISTIDNESWYNPATGFTGGKLSGTGGTNAHQLSSLIDTIGANISFDRLQQMREESPTGGALGQVTVPELKLLQATKGAIVQSQNAEELKYNLNRLWNVQQDTVHGKGKGPERRKLTLPNNVKGTQTPMLPPPPNQYGLPPDAIKDLMSDPSPESQAMFDEIFGAGAAQRALGGR